MYPAHRCRNSYPYRINPMLYAPIGNPGAKEIDPRILNSPYQPWPYGSNHHYPVPQEHHGRCNHNYFSGPYGFQPPYYHYPPPPLPPCYTHGAYDFPPYPPFPATYSIPPPHYSVEQPQYDYEKDNYNPRHCCGCNHHEDDKKLRIEPEDQEIDKIRNDSLIPSQLKDYPYPIMWIPPGYMKNGESEAKKREKCSDEPVPLKALEPLKEGGNDDSGRDKSGEETYGLPFPIIWLPWKNNQSGKDTMDKNLDQEACDDGKMRPKDSEVESDMVNKHGVPKVIPVKQMVTEEEKKNAESLKGKETKLEKTSKLPPVCLRIDPLPRKKNGSRSPSPPINKRRPKEMSTEDLESSPPSDGLKNINEERREIEAKNVEKQKFSEHKAALIIQSAYRGFEVRKSQPLMKLKQIAQVGKQVLELRNRVQDLVSSSSTIDKQKLIIGETIMSLLLKLDMIQGLHPIVRDARKSVVKELVGLQEKLDSLTSVNSETLSDQTIMNSKPDDNAIQEAQSNSNLEFDSGVNVDREVEAKESQNLEPQVEPVSQGCTGQLQMSETDQHVDTDVETVESEDHGDVQTCDMNINMELSNDQLQTSAETGLCMEVPATTSVLEDGGDIKETIEDAVGVTEHKDGFANLNLDSQESTGELNGDQLQTSVEAGWSMGAAAIASVVEEGGNIKEMVEPVAVKDEPSIEDAVGATEHKDGFANLNMETQVSMRELINNQLQTPVETGWRMEAPATPLVEEGGNVKEMESVVVKDESPIEDAIGMNGIQEEKDGYKGGNVAASGGDRMVMEENERLKEAVEEQLGVITELTGRVKDLERKLWRKKKRKTRKGRSRSCVVQDEF